MTAELHIKTLNCSDKGLDPSGVSLINSRPPAVKYTKILLLAKVRVTALFWMIALPHVRSTFEPGVYAVNQGPLLQGILGPFVWI